MAVLKQILAARETFRVPCQEVLPQLLLSSANERLRGAVDRRAEQFAAHPHQPRGHTSAAGAVSGLSVLVW